MNRIVITDSQRETSNESLKLEVDLQMLAGAKTQKAEVRSNILSQVYYIFLSVIIHS